MKHIQIFVVVMLTFFCTCCEKDPTPTTPGSNGTEFPIDSISPEGTESYLEDNSDYIFNDDTLHTFHLRIPISNFDILNDDPAAEEYVEGQLIFDGDTISPVGIRYKGSVGGFVGCVSGSDWWDPSGFKTCTKLSMKVKINWEGREERFYGLKKLQFHSMNLDPSQMRERLGYHLYREMGVPAPRSVHARLVINDEYAGLFALTEQIDGRFTRYNYEDGKGNLYKEIWPLKMDGSVPDSSEFYAKLKTNEDEFPSMDRMIAFGETVRDASEDNLAATVTQFMDLDEILALWAVDRTIRHDDGPYHWYCDDGDCENHNYYWYEEPISGKLHLIPWDLDNAFENIIQNENPVTRVADDWGETTNDCNIFSFGPWGIDQWSASCDKLTRSWTLFPDQYETKRQQLISGPMAANNVDALIEKWKNQITAATTEAMEAHEDAITVSEWDAGVSALKNQVEFARNQ